MSVISGQASSVHDPHLLAYCEKVVSYSIFIETTLRAFRYITFTINLHLIFKDAGSLESVTNKYLFTTVFHYAIYPFAAPGILFV